MYCERTKVVLLLFSNLVFMFICCTSSKTYLSLNSTDIKNLLQRRNDTFTTPCKRNLFANTDYQIPKELNKLHYQGNASYYESFLDPFLTVLNKEEKRSIDNRDINTKKDIPKGKQRKIKALRRLLLNKISKEDDKDIQDDYIEDDDDDYSMGVNKKKMNWDDFQNEDGASVMELIALNVRHKSNGRPTRSIVNFYRH